MTTRQLQVAKPNSCPCPVKIKLFYHQCRISLGPGIIRNQSGVTKAQGTHYHTHIHTHAHRHIDKDEGKDVPRMSVCMQHSATWIHRGQWLCAHPCSAEANAEWWMANGEANQCRDIRHVGTGWLPAAVWGLHLQCPPHCLWYLCTFLSPSLSLCHPASVSVCCALEIFKELHAEHFKNMSCE